jgi:hypothetical protein
MSWSTKFEWTSDGKEIEVPKQLTPKNPAIAEMTSLMIDIAANPLDQGPVVRLRALSISTCENLFGKSPLTSVGPLFNADTQRFELLVHEA